MQMIRKVKKDEKGSVTIFVVTSIIVVILVLSAVNLGASNKIGSQTEEIKNIEEEYKAVSTDEVMKQEYINNIEKPQYEAEVTAYKTDGSWSEEKGVNVPNITPLSGMQLVKYDEVTKTWIDDETNFAYDYDANRYYDKSAEEKATFLASKSDNRNNKWANARVNTNGEDSYFVWIPRFEYRIREGAVEVKFIPVSQTSEDKPNDGYPDYFVHPAFLSSKRNGGWREDIPGFWIGKFESSKSNAAGNSICIIPGVNSFQLDYFESYDVNSAYNYSFNYNRNLESHLIKNSEWGAVAILALSQYGRNGNEVRLNNSMITGSAGGTDNAAAGAESYAFNTPNGVLASTTGNVYGVYDMSGGLVEYTSAYNKGSNYLNNGHGNAFAKQDTDQNTNYSTEYATAYEYQKYNMGADWPAKPVLGDACDFFGWFSDFGVMSNNTLPFFLRGGRYSQGERSGLFAIKIDNGIGNYEYGFRVTLTPNPQK